MISRIHPPKSRPRIIVFFFNRSGLKTDETICTHNFMCCVQLMSNHTPDTQTVLKLKGFGENIVRRTNNRTDQLIPTKPFVHPVQPKSNLYIKLQASRSRSYRSEHIVITIIFCANELINGRTDEWTHGSAPRVFGWEFSYRRTDRPTVKNMFVVILRFKFVQRCCSYKFKY